MFWPVELGVERYKDLLSDAERSRLGNRVGRRSPSWVQSWQAGMLRFLLGRSGLEESAKVSPAKAKEARPFRRVL